MSKNKAEAKLHRISMNEFKFNEMRWSNRSLNIGWDDWTLRPINKVLIDSAIDRIAQKKEQIKFSARRLVPDYSPGEENDYCDNKIITLKVPHKAIKGRRKKKQSSQSKNKWNLPFINSKILTSTKNSISRWDVDQNNSECLHNEEETFCELIKCRDYNED